MTRFAALFILILGWAVPVPVHADQPVTVFAAASLRGVIDDIAEKTVRKAHLSFGGSGTMARQVAAGAPADVVVLANSQWLDWLVMQGVVRPENTSVIAQNRLVLIAPAGADPIQNAAELPQWLLSGRLAMGHRDAVPAGVYTRQWLEKVGIWDAVRGKLAETDNVRAALALVARGDVPLGAVYATDARAEPRVNVVFEIPDTAHDPIQYFATALTANGSAFITTLTSSEARTIFAAYGFAPVPE